MTSELVIAPDERAFRAHVGRAAFAAGIDRGRWRVLDIAWPYVQIAVTAAPRTGAPGEFVLRFELSGYPTSAPTATPWNAASGTPLAPESRPKGEFVGHVFRTDWEDGRALYAPFDRVALESHADWRMHHSSSSWDETKDITFYVQQVWQLLNDEDYVGV
jgi:hypothetical protein